MPLSLMRRLVRRDLPLVAVLLGAASALPAQQASATLAPARAADSAYRAPALVQGTGPGGATLRCRDGSHPAPNAPDAACQDRGGVLLRYPVRRRPAPVTEREFLAAPAVPKTPDPIPPPRVRPAEGEAVGAKRPPV